MKNLEYDAMVVMEQIHMAESRHCLLYTSDAADDLSV